MMLYILRYYTWLWLLVSDCSIWDWDPMQYLGHYMDSIPFKRLRLEVKKDKKLTSNLTFGLKNAQHPKDKKVK